MGIPGAFADSSYTTLAKQLHQTRKASLSEILNLLLNLVKVFLW